MVEDALKDYVVAIAACVAANGWGDLQDQLQPFWVIGTPRYVNKGPSFNNTRIPH